jgi:hypothetical protein
MGLHATSKHRLRASGSSSKFRITGAPARGRLPQRQLVSRLSALERLAVAKSKQEDREKRTYLQCVDLHHPHSFQIDMSLDEREQLQEIRDAICFEASLDHDDDDDESNWHDLNSAAYNPSDAILFEEVLRGERTLDPSHHGGEFRELLVTMTEELGTKR